MDKKAVTIDIKKILIIIIIAVIAVIAIKTIKNKSNSEEKLKNLYQELSEKQEYQFTINEGNNKTIIAKKGNNTIIDMYIEGEHTTTLVKEGNTYLILHDKEEYYVYSSSETEENILLDELKEIVEKTSTKGKEKIENKNYKYEEYEGVSTFMTYTGLGINADNIKARFYFKGNELKFIKTIYGSEEVLQKVELAYSVSDEMFEIPSNYAEN